ncbi:MAG: hypothetical protein H0V01_09425 [Bacteroidetes bacterium]|nr:hypothetical protein [Bacteroidota bacterium]HET6243039.1 hypothetical protein [Bacteroidia bacterium]
MDKFYSFNKESCVYEEVSRPFLMHNLMLLALMFTSGVFFLLTCFYYAQNEETLGLAPLVAKNCYSQVDSLKQELVKQNNRVQLMANLQYLIKNATLKDSVRISKPNNNILLIQKGPNNDEFAYAK